MKPLFWHLDMGSEFVTGPMKDLYEEYEITRYSTHNTDMKVRNIICCILYAKMGHI